MTKVRPRGLWEPVNWNWRALEEEKQLGGGGAVGGAEAVSWKQWEEPAGEEPVGDQGDCKLAKVDSIPKPFDHG